MPKIKRRNKETEDLIQDFIDYCSYKNLSSKTIKSYNQTLMLFAKYLEEEKNELDITKTTKKDVEEYLEFTKERGKYSFISNIETLNKNHMDKRKDVGQEISEATLNNYLRNIKVFFNWMESNEVIKKNTISDCKFIKVQRTSKDQLSDLEFKKLIRTTDLTKFHEYRDYIIINLIFDSGMRLSETLSLNINDIDLSRKTIYLTAKVTKGKKDRVVFYSNQMLKLLKKWIRYKDVLYDTDLLFPTRGTVNQLTASNFERNFREYIKRSKIDKKITPHSLRNNFARRFLLASKDIYALSRILGHSSVTVTEKAYLDYMDDDLRSSYQKFSPLENMRD